MTVSTTCVCVCVCHDGGGGGGQTTANTCVRVCVLNIHVADTRRAGCVSAGRRWRHLCASDSAIWRRRRRLDGADTRQWLLGHGMMYDVARGAALRCVRVVCCHGGRDCIRRFVCVIQLAHSPSIRHYSSRHSAGATLMTNAGKESISFSPARCREFRFMDDII